MHTVYKIRNKENLGIKVANFVLIKHSNRPSFRCQPLSGGAAIKEVSDKAIEFDQSNTARIFLKSTQDSLGAFLMPQI